jgi:hypothetical protein
MTYLNKIGVFFLIGLILIPFVQSQSVVQVDPQQEEETNIFLQPFQLLTSTIFWGAVVIFVFVIILAIGVMFIIRYVIKFIKLRNDVFYKVKTERLKLAKTHKRYPSRHWWKVHKNTPIRLVRQEAGRIYVTKPIAYHRGDYITHEGSFILSMNLVGHKSFFVFPKIDLLIIPNKDNLKDIQKDKDGKEIEITLYEDIPRAEKIIQFNDDEILLFAESVSSTGMFYVPVLRSGDDEIIDLSMPVYQNLKKVVLNDFLYSQTSEFGQIAKKSMDLNPYVRSAMKLQDSSSNVEIPSDNK